FLRNNTAQFRITGFSPGFQTMFVLIAQIALSPEGLDPDRPHFSHQDVAGAYTGQFVETQVQHRDLHGEALRVAGVVQADFAQRPRDRTGPKLHHQAGILRLRLLLLVQYPDIELTKLFAYIHIGAELRRAAQWLQADGDTAQASLEM